MKTPWVTVLESQANEGSREACLRHAEALMGTIAGTGCTVRRAELEVVPCAEDGETAYAIRVVILALRDDERHQA